MGKWLLEHKEGALKCVSELAEVEARVMVSLM